jgi:hypothetical protein
MHQRLSRANLCPTKSSGFGIAREVASAHPGGLPVSIETVRTRLDEEIRFFTGLDGLLVGMDRDFSTATRQLAIAPKRSSQLTVPSRSASESDFLFQPTPRSGTLRAVSRSRSKGVPKRPATVTGRWQRELSTA